MIRVTVYKNEKDQCIGFKALGHAGYSEEGQDIVCAAVSVLTINTVNSIEAFTEDETSLLSDESAGLIDFQIKGNPSSEAELLLNAMLLGLEEIAEDMNYRKYMDLTYEEV